MNERVVNVFVHGQFYKKVLREAKYDYVTISALTSRIFDGIGPMVKEFHAAIRGCEFCYTANFGDAELAWEGDNIIYKPVKP